MLFCIGSQNGIPIPPSQMKLSQTIRYPRQTIRPSSTPQHPMLTLTPRTRTSGAAQFGRNHQTQKGRPATQKAAGQYCMRARLWTHARSAPFSARCRCAITWPSAACNALLWRSWSGSYRLSGSVGALKLTHWITCVDHARARNFGLCAVGLSLCNVCVCVRIVWRRSTPVAPNHVLTNNCYL